MTAACAYASHARSRLPSGVGHRLSAMLDTLSAGLRLLGSTIGVDAWRRHRIVPGTGGVDPALNCLLSLLDGLNVGLPFPGCDTNPARRRSRFSSRSLRGISMPRPHHSAASLEVCLHP